ncbi:helix-turn-helix domain-containing protein [Caulobacter segnis]
MDVPSLLDSTGLKTAEIARRAKTSDGHIWDLRSGRRQITLKMAKRLDDALKTEARSLRSRSSSSWRHDWRERVAAPLWANTAADAQHHACLFVQLAQRHYGVR